MTNNNKALKAWKEYYEEWQKHIYLEHCLYTIENLLYRINNRKITVADVLDECKYPFFPGFGDLDKKTPLTKLKVEYILPYIDFDYIEDIDDFFAYMNLNGNVIEKISTEPADFFIESTDIYQDETDPHLFHVELPTITWSLRISAKYKRNEYQVIGLRTYPDRPIKDRYHSYVKEMRDHFKSVETETKLEKIVYTHSPSYYSIHNTYLDLTNNKEAIEMYEESGLLEDWSHSEIRDKHKIWYTRKNINQLGYKNPTDREIVER